MKLKTKNNKQIVKDYFGYYFPLFLVNDLYKNNKNKNVATLKYINESQNALRNSFNNEEIVENENLNKQPILMKK